MSGRQCSCRTSWGSVPVAPGPIGSRGPAEWTGCICDAPDVSEQRSFDDPGALVLLDGANGVACPQYDIRLVVQQMKRELTMCSDCSA